jgi:hypothetical protein
VLALGCLLAVAGSLLSTGERRFGLVLAAVRAVSLAVEAASRPVPIRALFPHRATQHMLTGVLVEGVVLMITAACDAPQRGPVITDHWHRPAGPDDRAARRPGGGRRPCAVGLLAGRS